jgi:hypothetical protein
MLAQEVICAVMFWSYVPLFALGITAATFAVKMPIEVCFSLFSNDTPVILTTLFQEKVILDSPNIGPEYEQYQKKVTARVIPYLW